MCAKASEPKMFIVAWDGQHVGPFLEWEAAAFVNSKATGSATAIPLVVPRGSNDSRELPKFQLFNESTSRTHLDSFKIDSEHVQSGILWAFFYAREEDRVFTANEMRELWKLLFRVSQAFKSLMRYTEAVIAEPSQENLVQLRRAFWRNRDSDDVDPEYHNRYW